MKFLHSLSEKLLPALFIIAIMLAFDSPSLTVMTLLSAALHELGHLFVASLVSKKDFSLPRATFFGLKIHTGCLLSYKEELLIAFGGPAANLLAFLFLLPFCGIEYVRIFAIFNLFSAFSNLIPIRGYDGYRILSSILSLKKGGELSEIWLSHLSALLSGIGALVFLAFLMMIGEGYWIFVLFFASFIREIGKNTKSEDS